MVPIGQTARPYILAHHPQSFEVATEMLQTEIGEVEIVVVTLIGLSIVQINSHFPYQLLKLIREVLGVVNCSAWTVTAGALQDMPL